MRLWAVKGPFGAVVVTLSLSTTHSCGACMAAASRAMKALTVELS